MRRSLAHSWSLVAVLGPLNVVAAQEAEIDEIKSLKVKAAYLYNFGKFIEWPDTAFEGPNSAFVIAVVGSDPFGRILDETVSNKRVGDRPIRVVRLDWAKEDHRRELRRCHLVFVPGDWSPDAERVRNHCAGRPILVVGDRDDYVLKGGMIGFVLESGRIRFELSREALDRAGLRAGAQLLKLARIIDGPKRLELSGDNGSIRAGD